MQTTWVLEDTWLHTEVTDIIYMTTRLEDGPATQKRCLTMRTHLTKHLRMRWRFETCVSPSWRGCRHVRYSLKFSMLLLLLLYIILSDRRHNVIGYLRNTVMMSWSSSIVTMRKRRTKRLPDSCHLTSSVRWIRFEIALLIWYKGHWNEWPLMFWCYLFFGTIFVFSEVVGYFCYILPF